MNPVNVLVYCDANDPELIDYQMLEADRALHTRIHVGPRIVMSDMWNVLALKAKADILMLAADDLLFRTPCWDVHVAREFAMYPDGIVMVYGRDGVSNKPSHPFVTRRWVEVLGHFTSGAFAADYADQHLADVARGVNRAVYLPELYIEHLHPYVGKGPEDQTFVERTERMGGDAMHHLYESLAHERTDDIAKLREAMA